MNIMLKIGEEVKRFSGVSEVRFGDIDLRVEEYNNLAVLYMENGFSVGSTNDDEITITVNQKVRHEDRVGQNES